MTDEDRKGWEMREGWKGRERRRVIVSWMKVRWESVKTRVQNDNENEKLHGRKGGKEGRKQQRDRMSVS